MGHLYSPDVAAVSCDAALRKEAGMGRQSESIAVARLKTALLVTGHTAAVLLVLAPLYVLLKYAISDTASINTGGNPIPLWSYHPTLRMFVYFFTDRQFYAVVMNDIVIAGGTVALSMLLGGIPAAYVLVYYRVPGRKIHFFDLENGYNLLTETGHT